MKKVLIVIDMQKDFIDGSLGTKEAVSIVDKVKEKIKQYKENGEQIIYTRAGVTQESHKAALLIMKMCQIEIRGEE